MTKKNSTAGKRGGAGEKSDGTSFESSMKTLEDIVERLENGSVPLEEALALYEEGVKISKACLETLEKAELRLKFLVKDMNGMFTVTDEADTDGTEDDEA